MSRLDRFANHPHAVPSIDSTGLHPTILLMATAHLVVDGYGNIYAPLLPLLIPRLGLSLAMAGTLALAFQLAASVAQLGFGHLADRWRPRVLVMAGPAVAVVILSLVGLAQSAAMLALILVAGGLGCAAFHPPAAALAHKLGGNQQGLAMSVYITGGTLGFSFGPLAFAPFVQRFGLEWTPLLALPGLLIVAFFLIRVPPMRAGPDSHDAGLMQLKPYAKPLALLYTIVVFRTLTALSFATFLPVMLTRRGMSLGQAGAVIALYLFASGVGGFFGGPLADRYGARRVIALSLLLSTPFLAAAPTLDGPLFIAVLAVGGLFLQSTLPVNVTFGQRLAPVSAATVSSLMMGFGWGTGGLSVPFVGMLADRIGIERTLTAIAVLPIVAAMCSWPLPARGRIQTEARPADVGISETG
ncbi:MAG: MFS transporter [Acidobacteria bacterium]|nr:MFS transporter [Acidobacteriota bacterium]